MKSLYVLDEITIDFWSVSFMSWDDVGPIVSGKPRRKELRVYLRGDAEPLQFSEKVGRPVLEAWQEFMRDRDDLLGSLGDFLRRANLG